MDIISRYLNGLEVPKDELTSLERTTFYGKGQAVDRIPCCLDGGESMSHLIGAGIDEYYFSSEIMCNVEEYIHEKFGSDGAGISTSLRGMAEAMGSEIKYTRNNVAQLKKPALKLSEVDNAKLVDIDKDGRLPVILDAVRKVKERLGDKVSVSASVTGPLSIAAMVVGTENLLIGMIKKPQQVHQLMEVIVENNNRLIKRLVEMGVGIGFPDPVSSTALISVEQYRKFSLPYFKRNVDYVKSLGGGCGLHICGTSRKLWEDLRETGIGAFSLDNVEDLEEAKRVLGGKMGIQGNVPPVDVMKLGTPHDVLRSARECIRKGWDSPNGFTLTSGCQMPAGTPEENMQALMDAARIFGRYPLDKSLLED
ncbi:MAG: uroporphyrinogen decarboxylase family protein [Clostridia bacterium]|nr:uroporphyrinogen decarboxylase family protein [Clostridia bacterium]